MSKNSKIILQILKSRWECGVTELIKICYLIDLSNKNDNGKKLSDFSYIRYNYGPFDKEIYKIMEDLTEDWLVDYKLYRTSLWDEIIKYVIRDVNEKIDLKETEIEYIDDKLGELWLFTASDLTKIAYRTKPLTDLKASIWGREWFKEKIL